MTFRTDTQSLTLRPPGFVLLDPSAFADSWHARPSGQVAIGISPLSESAVQLVKAEAARKARELYPQADVDDELLNQAFEDKLMALAVARSTCDPNDAGKPYFEFPDDDVPEALRSATVRRLWDELERVTIAVSAVMREATDGDFVELSALAELVSAMPVARAKRLRRLVAFCVDELRAVKDAVG